MRWNYYKLRQLSLLQSAMDCYYKLRQLFYYKLRQVLQSAMDLLQIATGIAKCDDYYKLRQYSRKQSHKKGDGIGVGRTSQKVSIFF